MLLAVALMLAQAAPVQADSATEQARQHYANGTKQYDMGHWDEAIAEFEKAYDLRPDPSFLFNLAQAHRRKGDLKRAQDLYKNYAIKLPKGQQREEVEEKIAALQKQIEEAAAKSASPAPATTEAASPTVSPPPAGEAPLTPVAPNAAVVPNPPAQEPWPEFIPPATATQAAPAPAPEAPPVASVPVATSEASAPRPGQNLRIAGVVCGSVGLASMATGAVFGWQARTLSNRVTDAKQFKASDDSAGQRAETLQWVSYGIGAAAVVAGGLLYFWGATAAPAPTSRISLAPVLGPNTTGLSAVGVF